MHEDFRYSIHLEPTYRRGEPIPLRFEIENVSDQDLIFIRPIGRAGQHPYDATWPSAPNAPAHHL
jgi:hypothetical protein